MKKFSCVLLSAVLMLSLAACSGEEKKLYAGHCTYYPDGGLMNFTEYSYEYDKDGNILNECEYHNGYPYSSTQLVYDKTGTFTESVYNSRDELESLKEFDENGIISKEYQYASDGSVKLEIDYNEEGSMVRKESLDAYHYVVEYEYDESGNLTKQIETDYDDKDDIENIYEYLYDSEGEMIQRTLTSADGSEMVDLIVETVVEGNKTTIYTYGPFDELRFFTEKKYDTHGNLIKEVTYKVEAGKNEVLTSEEYTYDSQNRVIDYIYKLSNTTETKYEYSTGGYLEKESIISEKWISLEGYGDGSDAILTECVTINYYNAEGDMTKTENLAGGLLGSYTEYFYENVKIKSGSKSKFDFRDRKRKLDPRSMVVY